MLVPNKTHYYNLYSKVYNIVPDCQSFGFLESRRVGCFQRLYFEYLDTQRLGGVTLFYTFTYNNRSIPIYQVPQSSFKHYTFSYKDIRYITNGALSKWLLRKYGASLKYFVVCESGEGKGSRGAGNNPHYHIIFFIQPSKYAKCPFVCPDCFSFYDKVREIWTGSKSYINFRSAKYGIVESGDCCGVVQSSAAFSYVIKYITKDIDQINQYKQIAAEWREYYSNSFLSPSFMRSYYYFLKNDFATNWITDRRSFVDYFCLHQYWLYRKFHPSVSYRDFLLIHYLNVSEIIPEFELSYYRTHLLYHKLREYFDNIYFDAAVSSSLNEYVNNYSGKVRMSKTLGYYGLNFVLNVETDPQFKIPTKDGYLFQRPALVYMRQLYYNVVKCSHTGNPLYVLNELGVNLRCSQLPGSIDSLITRTLTAIDTVIKNKISLPSDIELFDGDSVHNPPNYDCNPLNLRLLELSRSHYDPLLRLYSIYKLVYEFRHYDSGTPILLSDSLNIDDITSDYRHFITRHLFMMDFDTNTLLKMLPNCDCVSFASNPIFKPYIDLFKLLDIVVFTYDSIISDSRNSEFAARRDLLKRLKAQYYNVTVA